MAKSDYVGADSAKLDEIIRQAESRLASQLSLAVAADQRAMTFAGILAALAAALVALATDKGLSLPVGILIVVLLLATFFAILAAQPIAWAVAGNSPDAWVEDIAEGKDDLKSAKAAMADYYADMIAENDERMAGNGNLIRLALWAAFMAPILAGAALLTQ